MAKNEAQTLEVYLGNDWYDGGKLLRTVFNPHFLPESRLDELPSSAKVMQDGEKVSVDELRSKTKAEPEGKTKDLKI